MPELEHIDLVSIHSLLTTEALAGAGRSSLSRDGEARIAAADVIFAHDTDTGRDRVVHGRRVHGGTGCTRLTRCLPTALGAERWSECNANACADGNSDGDVVERHTERGADADGKTSAHHAGRGLLELRLI